MRKRSPIRSDLFGWFLWEKLAVTPIGDFDNPLVMKDWVEEFETADLTELHDRFYDKYPAFLDKFYDAEQTGGKY